MAFATAQIDNTTTKGVHKNPCANARGWRHWIQFPSLRSGRVRCVALPLPPFRGVDVRRLQGDGARVIAKVSPLHHLFRQRWIRRVDFTYSLTYQERYFMKPLYNFVSDNGPFLFVSGLVLSIAASLLTSTAAYIHASF